MMSDDGNTLSDIRDKFALVEVGKLRPEALLEELGMKNFNVSQSGKRTKISLEYNDQNILVSAASPELAFKNLADIIGNMNNDEPLTQKSSKQKKKSFGDRWLEEADKYFKEMGGHEGQQVRYNARNNGSAAFADLIVITLRTIF